MLLKLLSHSFFSNCILLLMIQFLVIFYKVVFTSSSPGFLKAFFVFCFFTCVHFLSLYLTIFKRETFYFC